MPDPRYPQAFWNPGAAAGYAHGRTTMETVVCHYTVGRDSTGIGLQGYFHFLVARDGGVQQFCETDAVAWHAGDPWNGRGPGVEIEYLESVDGPMPDNLWTPQQASAAGQLCGWLEQEWGIPAQFYDGPRVNAW